MVSSVLTVSTGGFACQPSPALGRRKLFDGVTEHGAGHRGGVELEELHQGAPVPLARLAQHPARCGNRSGRRWLTLAGEGTGKRRLIWREICLGIALASHLWSSAWTRLATKQQFAILQSAGVSDSAPRRQAAFLSE